MDYWKLPCNKFVDQPVIIAFNHQKSMTPIADQNKCGLKQTYQKKYGNHNEWANVGKFIFIWLSRLAERPSLDWSKYQFTDKWI